MSATTAGVLPRSERPSEWLYGPWTDLLIGCGLGYALMIPLLYVVNKTTGLSAWPGAVAMALSLLVNTPHYGATIVRVYEAREQRRKYFVFTVYMTLAMTALFAASSRSVWLASALITVYVNWNPWHASGQNYGLTLLFLRRRGVPVDPVTKRLLYASFVLSAASAILALNTGSREFSFLPQTLPVANAAGYTTFAPPAALAVALWAAVFLGYVGCLGAATWRLCQHASPRDLAPASILVFSQALWFAIPALLLARGVQIEALVFSTILISVAHSVQYLWVTAYYAKSTQNPDSTKRFLLKSLVAGTAVLTLPGLIMAPNVLGKVPWDAGLASTLFAVVNLHHFILDGAIWKLRDGRVARILLRGPSAPEASFPAVASGEPAWASKPGVDRRGAQSVDSPHRDLWESRAPERDPTGGVPASDAGPQMGGAGNDAGALPDRRVLRAPEAARQGHHPLPPQHRAVPHRTRLAGPRKRVSSPRPMGPRA